MPRKPKVQTESIANESVEAPAKKAVKPRAAKTAKPIEPSVEELQELLSTTTADEPKAPITNAIEMTEPKPSEPTTSEPRANQPTEQNGQKVWAPRGPLWFQTVQLSSTNEGPRMRLGRDNRYNQMAISFDEKPCEDSRKRLHTSGWKWRQAESQWTKQLEIDHRATGQQDAEKLFEELAKIERRERQLDEQLEAIRR